MRLAILPALLTLAAAAFYAGCSPADADAARVPAGTSAGAGSVALGRTNHGTLRHARDVLALGAPLRLLPKTVPRDLRYTTDELATALAGAAARVAAEFPGSVLSLGNLSARAGGPIPFSVSHQNGLDADVAFYVRDAAGAPALPPDYLHFGADLRSRDHGGGWRFDTPRTWAFVRALLSDPTVDVQWLFVSTALRAVLLARARSSGAPPALLARAARVLHQPGDAPPHDDHLHVRIYCPAGDRPLGCEDRGPRWP